MHPEIRRENPGNCPKCGMKLVLESDIEKTKNLSTPQFSNNYKPLYIIISLILLVTVSLSIKDLYQAIFSIEKSMSYFMSGFFLIFSGFKLLDVKGFAQGYSTYDLLAKRFFNYGYIYPFIELFLGVMLSIGINNLFLKIFIFILMSFSGIGVFIKLLKHERFQCVCLGTFLKVPLTKVTLIEDFGMAAMSLFMIFL